MKIDIDKKDGGKVDNGAQRNIALYDREARRLTLQYDALTTPQAMPDFARRVLELKSRETLHALDLGCGSGRDALWMANQGLHVTAVDGATAMIDIAKADKPHVRIDYMQDAAPLLQNLAGKGRSFDVILASAFLFHFDKDGRAQILDSIKNLAKPGATVYFTLRRGPVPVGRDIYDVSPDELRVWAQAAGATFNHDAHSSDAMGRADISWDHIAIEF